MDNRPIIYAVDFDGTLCENKWPDIGDPNLKLIDYLKAEQNKGNEIILYTMREGDTLSEAVNWLSDKHDFVPDAVNDNLPVMKAIYGNNPRKIYADIYIDDHNARPGIDLPEYVWEGKI